MKVTDHILDRNLNRYARREADAAEILRIQTHLAACDACRQKLASISGLEKSFAAVRESFAFDELSENEEHLTYEQLEFFLDHKLDAVEQEIVESHLAFCGECEGDLKDLVRYREIAGTEPAVKNEIILETPQVSIWKKLFAFDSFKLYAPIAAILLVAAMFGGWLLLRGNYAPEMAGINKNQNVAPANFNAGVNNSAKNVAPEISPTPEVSPTPTENLPDKETIYALNDGNLKIDDEGNLQGAEDLSPATRDLVKQSLKSGKISVTNNQLGGSGGVLMSETSANKGVPFGLETPIGKVIRENQPLLRWKPLKEAESYSVVIVDENFRVVEQSGKLTLTSWKPAKSLPRGANYSWQVTAMLRDGTETVSPTSPAPQARFRVIEQNLNDEIGRLEKSSKRSHLALGVLYAKAGLKQEARAEFEKLLKENPNSPLARKLLESVR